MLITARNPVAGTEVEFDVLGPNGEVQTVKFIAQFHRMKRTAYQELVTKLNRIGLLVLDDNGKPLVGEDGLPTGEVHQPPFETDVQFLQERMAGWVHVDREFSKDELASFIEDWPESVVPLADAFHRVHAAVPRGKKTVHAGEAREKN
jgi:hypothetical protein